jgi:hypothetical protein
MLNWALRYAPVVRFVRETSGTILEVGSGNRGLAAFIGPRKCFGVDLNFTESCSPNLIPVRASAIALPFRDGAFDCVVSLDMLEHIAQTDRAAVIAELVRVTSQYLVIGFPSGEAALRSDRRVKAFFDLFGKSPDWLEEHLSLGGHPTVESVQTVIGDGARLIEMQQNSNATLHALITIGDHLPGMNWLMRGIAKVGLVSMAAPLLNIGKPYRFILFYAKRDRELGPNGDKNLVTDSRT